MFLLYCDLLYLVPGTLARGGKGKKGEAQSHTDSVQENWDQVWFCYSSLQPGISERLLGSALGKGLISLSRRSLEASRLRL